MPRTPAVDDFETMRREKLREQSAANNAARVPGHRGPCACGLSLFPDECDGSCKAL
jgi:hypothetical protein